MTPATASTSDGDLPTAHDERWLPAPVRDNRRLLFAVAAALSIHLLPVLFTAVGLPSMLEPPVERGFGDPSGIRDGVNVETIDATEFQNRYTSFGAGKDDVSTQPVEAAPPPTPPPMRPTMESEPAEAAPPTRSETAAAEAAAKPAPPEPEVGETAPPEIVTIKVKPQPVQPPAPTQQPPAPKPPTRADASKPTKLSEADIAEIIESTRLDRPSAVQPIDKAGAARLGEVSEYARSVTRKIGQVLAVTPRPSPPGPSGRVAIALLVSETGEVAEIAVIQAGGNPALEKLLVDRLRATRFLVPDKTVRLEERIARFYIDY